MANTLRIDDISEASAKLYLNADLADVHFLFNDGDAMQKVPANKAILAIRSPVFYRMFFGAIKEKGDVEIVDADIDSFKEFLQIFYLTEMVLSMENMEAVVRLADKYDALGYLNAACSNLIHVLALEKMCWGYQLALCVKHEATIEHCENKISHSPKGIFASDSFKHCELATLKRILELNLTCYEGDVLKACLTWAKQACQSAGLDENNSEHLKSQLGDCLKLIRFGQILIKDFTALTVRHNGLFTQEEFEDIVHMKTVNGFEPRIFNSNPREYKWVEEEGIAIRRGISDFKFNDSDVVSFTSNQPALLGRIYAPAIDFYMNDFDVNVIVKELNAFYSENTEKILHDGTYEAYSECLLRIDLSQSILIKADTLYEINLTVIDYDENEEIQIFQNWDHNEYAEGSFKNSVEECDLVIDFYKNPRLNYNNSHEGWISHLIFQTI